MEKQPTSYSDNSPGYNPAPGYPNQTGYPQGQPYGAPYQGEGPYLGQPVVTMQPTVHVATRPLAQPLPDYLGYSIFTLLCCCLPLGIAALVFSMKFVLVILVIHLVVGGHRMLLAGYFWLVDYSQSSSDNETRDANTSGNRPLAERNSRTAFILNNTALGIGIVFTIVYIVLIVIINMSY